MKPQYDRNEYKKIEFSIDYNGCQYFSEGHGRLIIGNIMIRGTTQPGEIAIEDTKSTKVVKMPSVYFEKKMSNLFESVYKVHQRKNVLGSLHYRVEKSCKDQLKDWINGVNTHNKERDECCPDFSCCNREIKTPFLIREKFCNAVERGDANTIEDMLAGFLKNMISLNIKKWVFLYHQNDNLNKEYEKKKMFLQRKLRATYAGDEKYHPEQMPAGKYLPVIGWDSKLLIKQGGKQVQEPYLIIIGNDGKPLEVVMFNLKVMIDDRSELDMVQLSGICNNLTIMGTALCEKLTGIHVDRESEEIQEETGKGPGNTTDKPV